MKIKPLQLHYLTIKNFKSIFTSSIAAQTIKRTSFPRLLSSVPMAEPELKPKPDSKPDSESELKPDSESEPKPDVDPPNNVRFDMNDGKRIFMCRLCRNHLATWENCSHYISGGKQPGYLCYPVVNVKTDHVSSVWFLYKFPVVNVRCNRCDTHLGEKFFALSSPYFEQMHGSILLHPDRILLWDGTKEYHPPWEN
ncbi:hypothetical protein V6Z11_A03G052000 [Gossypium hirsutum]|uniref:Yippee domain-containing protein n=1 Tax=Gossypium hirsutum TaxID=3635 RepID=A0ABM3B7V8_GOSHI|nr:uncharacterized protein LOC107887997 [Gossypium hirsutum]